MLYTYLDGGASLLLLVNDDMDYSCIGGRLSQKIMMKTYMLTRLFDWDRLFIRTRKQV